jgi:hypothetical protein
MLVPLTTTLVALIRERKKAAQGSIEWFRAQVAAANARNREAQRAEDVQWIKRPVYIRWTLWDPRTYTGHHHPNRWIAKQITRGTRRQRYCFRELRGGPSEDRWFLSIVRRGVLLSGNGAGPSSGSGLATPSHGMARWLWRHANRNSSVA